MKLLLIILTLMCSLPAVCQTEAIKEKIKEYSYCFLTGVMVTSEEFEFPTKEDQFLVKKLVVTLYLKKGELVAFNHTGFGFESKLGEKTVMELLKAPCVDMFKSVKKGKVRRGQKVVLVYEYFLQGPGKDVSPPDQKRLVKEFYSEEIENELKKHKKGGKILDVSYHLISVSYPIS
ncbi:hypothetical protein QWY85_19215 [Neolewinella lacunae]|uniref:Uncharacterized protein n=1 Tax=Neolewinella lacunae TaxID=1517758 RepID=A0A923T9B6_9BACT|nr:hypothetical protein [Neolewinella lacunae]MBC6994888.1 hypothetical protein [Neolewinella lacunae]MDN3636808.1 hypothetical protein [Neolewinella lacunae]